MRNSYLFKQIMDSLSSEVITIKSDTNEDCYLAITSVSYHCYAGVAIYLPSGKTQARIVADKDVINHTRLGLLEVIARYNPDDLYKLK